MKAHINCGVTSFLTKTLKNAMIMRKAFNCFLIIKPYDYFVDIPKTVYVRFDVKIDMKKGNKLEMTSINILHVVSTINVKQLFIIFI